MKKYYLIILLTLTTTQSLRATEVDSFTHRDMPLEDSREVLNQQMQTDIISAIKITNAKFNCHESSKAAEEHFYKSFNQLVGGTFWAKFETSINKSSEIDKRHYKRKESVYKYLTLFDGWVLYFAKLGSVVNVGNNLVGTDKLGHFLGVGFIYFNKFRNKNKTIAQILTFGENSEKSYFGSETSSVYSYADLTSNYEGLLFWQNLFGGNEPFISCKDGELVNNKSFDWLNYITDAWDESINCNTYRTKKINNKVLAAIKKNVKSKAQCPIINMAPETISRYSTLPSQIINY